MTSQKTATNPRSTLVFSFDGSATNYEPALQVPGAHNEKNAMAAALVAWRLGVPPQCITDGLENFAGVKGRQEVLMRPGMVVINDAYNASPESCDVAITELAARPEGNKILVLGDMLELGADALGFHVEVLKKAHAAGIEKIFAFGENFTAAIADGGGRAFATKPELIAAARAAINHDCVVLVKGSNAMQLNEVVQALMEGA